MLKFEAYYLFILLFLATGCALSQKELLEKRQDANRSRAAGYAADGFTFNRPMPEREPNRYDFYYKHCQLIEQRLYSPSLEFTCSQP